MGNKRKNKDELEDDISDSTKKSNQRWAETETMNMLILWKKPETQVLFSKHRHNVVYDAIAVDHNLAGYERDGKEIKVKIRNLKTKYSKKGQSQEVRHQIGFSGIRYMMFGDRKICTTTNYSQTL